MITRSTALYDNRIIGIESIFTVIDGKQIYIPGKLAELRALSNKKLLTCPCGCGKHLVLVAGEKAVRAQHFRLAPGETEGFCTEALAKSESPLTISSKIALKCWLDQNLGDENLQSRVPIRSVSDSNRKFELTFLSPVKKVAVHFIRESIDITGEEIEALENNPDLKIFHFISGFSYDTDGQYPVNTMEIQKRQGYCLFLEERERSYEENEVRGVYYYQGKDGLWISEVLFSEKLSLVKISGGRILEIGGKSVEELVKELKARLSREKKKERLLEKIRAFEEKYYVPQMEAYKAEVAKYKAVTKEAMEQERKKKEQEEQHRRVLEAMEKLKR